MEDFFMIDDFGEWLLAKVENGKLMTWQDVDGWAHQDNGIHDVDDYERKPANCEDVERALFIEKMMETITNEMLITNSLIIAATYDALKRKGA